MSVVTLTYGSAVVEIEEVQEARPTAPAGLEMLPDINGSIVEYTRIPGLVTVPVSGRVKSKEEVEVLETFAGLITMTERDGTVSTGWRIQTEPPPTARKKDGDSPDYQVDLRLWRLP